MKHEKPKQYRIDISIPHYRKLYDRFRKWKNIPIWCPLSDDEREEFENYIIEAERKHRNG